jgi:hypothetical protein
MKNDPHFFWRTWISAKNGAKPQPKRDLAAILDCGTKSMSKTKRENTRVNKGKNSIC